MKSKRYAKSIRAILLAAVTLLPSLSYAQLKPLQACATNPTPFVPTSMGCNNPNWIVQIKGVQTKGGITNFTNLNNGCANLNGNAYSDYTAMPGMVVTQEAGKSFDVMITYACSPNTPRALNQVYIDWNNDGDFRDPFGNIDPDELCSSPWDGNTYPHPDESFQNNSVKTIKITVPGHSKEGKLRMRIINAGQFMAAQLAGNMSECSTGNLEGEIEDYVVEVINPCLPPNIISVEEIGTSRATLAWTKKANAELYEYLLKDDPATPASAGYSYSTDPKISVDTLKCDKTYYLFVRAVCETGGLPATQWKLSDWYVDSFRTHACCENPVVTVDRPDMVNRTMRISWPPVYTSIGYEYWYGKSDVQPTVPGTLTTSNIVVLQGLDPSARYYVFVRSRCNPTPVSGLTKVMFKAPQTLTVGDVEEHAVFGMGVYPNPVTDNMVIKLDGKMAPNARLTMLDLTGKIVYNAPVHTPEVKINTNSLAPGLYIVKYTDDVHNEVTRVTKK